MARSIRLCEDALRGRAPGYACLAFHSLGRRWQVYAGIPGSFPPEWVAGLRRRRWQVSSGFLKNTQLSISEVAAECGYADVNYFSYSFRTSMGVAPSAYRTSKRGDVS